MRNQGYERSFTVMNKPQEVFDAICQVSDWWTTNFEGCAKRLGDVFSVRFGETFVQFEISEVAGGKKIVWLVTDCYLHWLNDKKEWKGTKIAWEVSAKNGATKIDFTHRGLVPGIECYDQCVKGWNFYVMESLLKLLTEGKGLPETPKNLRN
jgi:hypothetical protein